MQNPNITLIIADDHPMMLKGLQQELEQVGYDVLATAKNGASAIEAIIKKHPDIALLDIEMPFLNGFEVVKRLKDLNLKTRFIMMSYHKEKGFVLQAKKVGVHGYLLKEDSITEIEQCIEQVMQDNNYYSKSFNEDFEALTKNELRKISLLTPSERTIIRLISQEKTSLEICEILSISKRTVDKHRTNIIAKLGLDSLNNSLLDWIQTHEEIVFSL
ncbi:response regulator transcription factor [Wenyingzhuangia sp. chi5]|uniref:Response regulator transcription factor n=1 Tax=Wenyingzhuangia gilva TaxID=3057677 RepID=A0ABT8VUM7_9FLAO|nr:response regulator transcription factor [Wenyingzhuangia sp. chi5]MDO3695667.1 response regulator transcription factor [Wenyingzhuangia sp. chi5]